MPRLPAALAVLAILLTPALPAQVTTASADLKSRDGIRAHLARYQDPIQAVYDGYFSTLGCVAYPEPGKAGQMTYPAGGMGVHFLNPALVGQPLDSLRPQVLIYEPVGDSLRLVAAEWFVPLQVTRERPRIFGRDFDGPMEGHHPIMPPEFHHWDLHVWLWKENPAGPFSPTNPAVRCPDRAYTFHEAPPKMVGH